MKKLIKLLKHLSNPLMPLKSDIVSVFNIKKQRNLSNKKINNVFNYLLPPTITGGEPPSEPGSPGTTWVLPSHLSRNNLKRT